MCKNFLATQRCDQEDCTFAHSLDELRATDKFYKTTMCCFYYYGSCKLGELCRHAHSKEELRSLPDVQGLPESLACALLIEQNGRTGDSRAVPRTPGPQEAEEQLQEIELLRRTVLEVKQQMGKLRPNEPRMAELQRREHQSLNRLQQLTELQTLQRFAATASSAPRAPLPPGGLMVPPDAVVPPTMDRRYLEQQELQEQMDQLKRQGELQELHQWKLQQQQQLLQQQMQLHSSRLPMNANFPPDLGYPAMPSSFGTGSIDTSLMKMTMQEEDGLRPGGPGAGVGGVGVGGLGSLGPGLSAAWESNAEFPTRMMEGFPMAQQVGNLENPYSRKASPPRSNMANFSPLNPQAPIGVALDRQRPQFDTFQRPPPPMQQPPPQPLPLAQPLAQPLAPQLPQPQPLQPQLPAQPLQPLQPLAGSSQGVAAMSDSQKELELLQQQIRYHQHMQKQMQQKVDERIQKLRDMGYNADNLQEEDEEDDDDSLGPIPGWSREGSLRDPNRKTPMTSPKMLRLEEAGRVDNGSQLDQLDEDFDEELGEDPKWVRTRTMPAAVNLKAQAAQQAAAAGDRPTPSVASTADTAGRSEKEDPGAEDLGPDPTWNRVHSTPAGSANYAAPQPMFQKGVGMSGAADDAFGPNRRATTMDQVRGRAMAPNIQQGVVPVMMLVPQTMMTQQMNGGVPYLMKQSVPVMQGVQGVGVGNVNVQNVQPQEDLRQMQAQVLQAAMPEIYED